MPVLNLTTWEGLSNYFYYSRGWSGIVLASILFAFVISIVAMNRRDRVLSLIAMVGGLFPFFLGTLSQFERVVFGLFLRAKLLDTNQADFSAGFYIVFFPILLAAVGSFLLTALNCIAIARSHPTPPKEGTAHAA